MIVIYNERGKKDMRRNIAKHVEEYRKLYKRDGEPPLMDFYPSDFQTLESLSGGSLYNAMSSALLYGFMRGYKYGKERG